MANAAVVAPLRACTRPALFAFLLADRCCAMVTRGSTEVSANGTSFLAKFCFDFDKQAPAGYFNITLYSATVQEGADLRILLLDDQASSYPDSSSGEWDRLSCQQKLEHAKWQQRVPGSVLGDSVLVPMREKIRPRWWFVAVADCAGVGASLRYDVHMWNPLDGWQSEFSHDHYCVSQMYIFFSVVFALIWVAHSRASASYRQRRTDVHPLLQVLTLGILCATFTMVVFTGHYLVFSHNGIGSPFLYMLGKFTQNLSKFLLMAIILLTSEGRCITYAMDVNDVRRLVRLLGPFFFLCLILECWGEFSDARNYTTSFVYATSLGRCLVFADLGFLALYAFNLAASYRAEQSVEKRLFYRRWGTLCAAWFLVLPFVTLLAYIVKPWVRFKVAMGTSNAAHALMYALLVMGFSPTAKQSFFTLDETELVILRGDDSLRKSCDAGYYAVLE